MTVKPIKKKEQVPMVDPKAKPDMEIESPSMQETDVDTGLPDHTHSEYDQALVMIQELQAEVAQLKQQMGVETLEDGGAATEALTGVPDKEDKERSAKDTDPIGPEGTSEVPQTTQPPVGDAPGDQDNEWDKMADDEANDAASKVDKPSSDYNRPKVTKNKLSKKEQVPPTVITDATAAEDQSPDQKEDPTKVKPVTPAPKEPEPMEGAQKQQMEGDYEDEDEKEAPVVTQESEGDIVDMEPEQEPKLTTELIVQREYEKLMKENKLEDEAKKKESLDGFDSKIEKQLTGKKTVVGGVRRTEEVSSDSDDVMVARQHSNNTVLEYLQKAGNTKALRTVQGF